MSGNIETPGPRSAERIAHLAHVRRLLAMAAERPDVVAAAGNFGGLIADPQLAAGTALVATTIEALWPAAQSTPITIGPGQSSRPGKTYEIRAMGMMTTAATGTLIITPSVGTAVGGATLGASGAVTVPASLTFPWFLHAIFVVRTAGPAGANGTIFGGGTFIGGGILANTSPGANLVVPFGGTSAAIDTTIASGITIAKTLSVAGSMTTHIAFMTDWN